MPDTIGAPVMHPLVSVIHYDELVNASVLPPLTSFTITSLTGLFCRSITRPVTFICADPDAVSDRNNIRINCL